MADGDRIRLAHARAFPESVPAPVVAPPAASPASRKKRLRAILLALGPLVVLVLGLYAYLAGGRFVGTDNAYVQADMLQVSTDVAGPVAEIAVRNNDRVAVGQVLFRLDEEPYRIALAGAQAQLASVRNDLGTMQASWREKQAEIGQVQTDIAFFEREFARQSELAQRNNTPQAKLDQARRDLDSSRQKLSALRSQAQGILAQLGGDPDQPVEKQARYLQAQAQVNRAERDLRRTAVIAPMAGIVTNVDKLQVGQYLSAGQTGFSLVASDHVWVEANPKETDLTYLRPGQKATVTIDAYPGRDWTASVASVSPASGAEFSLLPPQNASGNWVKVVQRIPVRLKVEVPEGAPPLRAGMSADISIDTEHKRSLGDLVRTLERWIGL